MREYNLKDLYRYEGERCHSLIVQLRYLFFTPGYRYSYLLRHTQNASNSISRFFWHALLRRCMNQTGIQIPWQTSIGPGIIFGHWGTIVINPSVKIGKNFGISHGCLIGNSQGKRKGVPTIGDNVIMHANAVIVGKCSIGNDVLIAPGAFVNFDVPDNSVVIGNPGKIIPRDSSPTKKYIVYPVDEFKKL